MVAGRMRTVVAAWVLAAGVACAQEAATVDIGSRRELFVDRLLIDRMDGTELRLHRPTPMETVLTFNEPWEGLYVGYVTVFQDGSRYRMYYRGMPSAGADGSRDESTCYAESSDGIHWTKPMLGLFEVKGTRQNNAVLAELPPFSHNFAPFLDRKPGTPPSERYKALAGSSATGLVGFVSSDGIHWEKLREEPLIREGKFDSQNLAFWSESEQMYVCYFRTYVENEFGGFRSISRTTSTDFLSWTAPEAMEFGDAPWDHLYTNQTAPYFRAPHIYVATAARFMPGRRVISDEQMEAIGGIATYAGDCSDGVLLTSRGGHRYDRTFMEAFVRPGIGINNWTSRTNYPAWGIVQTGPGEMSMYVQRNYGQLSHHLQRLAMRLDGFVSVNAPYAGGEMVTKPLTFEGAALAINYATSAPGGVRVEIQDAGGTAIAGYALEDCDEIIGDEIERVVTWKGSGDVAALAGKAVRLRFVMRDADLFSVRFGG